MSGAVERHAPRERVSWNVTTSSCNIDFWVTLHVSVWVEMHVLCALIRCYNVTLHVSVWVEIPIKMADNTSVASRSTWACELKFSVDLSSVEPFGHAPRERVSWNFKLCLLFVGSRVTLHVSVWVEIPDYSAGLRNHQSRSTWACELKYNSKYKHTIYCVVTLHVSVWVEMLTVYLNF